MKKRGLGLGENLSGKSDFAAEGFFGDYLKQQMDPRTPQGRWEREHARSDGQPPALARGVDDPKRLDMYDRFYEEANRQYRKIPAGKYGEQWDSPEGRAFQQRMREMGRSKGLTDPEIHSLFRYLRSLND